MENKINIMSIGDIHGRNSWKINIFGSLQAYDWWKNEVDEGIIEVMSDQYPVLHSMEKIIFVGDYVDSFDVSNEDMLNNLDDIIHFKRTYPEKVILLLGNHDIQYIVKDNVCSGFRPEMKIDIEQRFNDNADLFQICYLHIGTNPSGSPRRTLWTHAGITQGWLRNAKRQTMFNPKYRFYEEFRDLDYEPIDVFLEFCWKFRSKCLFDVDSDSGGLNRWAGPLWVRPTTLRFECVEGYDQIVGHTVKSEITHIQVPDPDVESNPEKIDILTFIDCNSKEVYINKF